MYFSFYQTKTYDAVTEKFLDFSFEKTHSAYMLFYEREETTHSKTESNIAKMDPELASWIWKDNIQFIRDQQIFDLTYYNFMWFLCSRVASTFTDSSQTTLSNVKLATSFLLETFIHSKEKPGLKGWSDLLNVHFDNSRDACEWFLNHMAEDSWWLHQIFLKCPVQATRQVRKDSVRSSKFIIMPFSNGKARPNFALYNAIFQQNR